MSISRGDPSINRQVNLLTSDALADVFAPVAADYVNAIRLTRGVDPADREGLLQARLDHYSRVLVATVVTARWLAGEQAA